MRDNNRRLLLRLGVKVMLLLAFLVTGYALLSSIEWPGQPPSPPASLTIDIPPVSHTHVTRVPWSGGNLILLRWPPGQPPKMPEDKNLYDPLSSDAHQPAGLATEHRSLMPGLFLAYDRGTDMGCPLEWVSADDPRGPLQPWPGGFRDTCRGSWYDAAGRVLSDQAAQRNLDIPPYRVITPDLLEVGVNGDNPASAK